MHFRCVETLKSLHSWGYLLISIENNFKLCWRICFSLFKFSLLKQNKIWLYKKFSPGSLNLFSPIIIEISIYMKFISYKAIRYKVKIIFLCSSLKPRRTRVCNAHFISPQELQNVCCFVIHYVTITQTKVLGSYLRLKWEPGAY